jgi:hypothetical protein
VRNDTRAVLAAALLLATGVAFRPSVPGAAAVVAVAALAGVLRRQDSRDAEVVQTIADRDELERLRVVHQDLAGRHTALREEFDRVKLMVPKPRQG